MSSGSKSGRTAKGFALLLGAARAASVRARPSSALAYVAIDDAALAVAIRNARDALPGFLALAKRPRATMKRFAVKIAILADDGAEHVWIYPFAHVEHEFIGQLSNTPHSAANLKIGDTVSFTENDIVDWMYMDAGVMKGNFCARAMLRSVQRREREAFKRRSGLDFDF